MLKEKTLINSGSNRPVALSGDSSVGRAITVDRLVGCSIHSRRIYSGDVIVSAAG